MTFGIKTEGADKAKTDIDGVAAATKNAEDSQEGLNDSIDSGAGALDNMTGGAIMMFKGVIGGVKKAVMGMRTLKGAIISTGIGALVIVVISLVSYFTKTKKGAEVLQVAMAALGAITGKITDQFSKLGEYLTGAFSDPKQALIDFGLAIKKYVMDNVKLVMDGLGFLGSAIKKVFSGDFSGAMEDAKKGALSLGEGMLKLNPATALLANSIEYIAENVGDFVEEVKAAVHAATSLEKRAIRLADAQRNLSVEFAQTRAVMNELRMVGEDTTKEIGVRIAAIEEAGALEQALADKSLALAQEAVDVKRAQNNITESTAEDLQALADLEIALSSAQIESAGKQRALLMKVNSLYNEQEAKRLETAAGVAKELADVVARQTAIDEILGAGQERELQKIRDFWIAKRAEAALQHQVLIGDKEAEALQLQAVEDKHAAVAKAKADTVKQAKIDTAKAVLDALSALNTAFTTLSGAETDANAARELAIQAETDESTKKQLIETNNLILGEQERQQKKGFENSKKIQIAQALIQTYQAATAAFSSLAGIPVVGPVLGGIAAAAAVAGGLAQVAMIKKTTFQGGGGSTEYTPPPSNSGGGGGGGGAAAAATGTNPQLDLGFLGGGAGGSIQAYVIGENVTNQQQADQLVTDQTTL